ncbi:serine/threonine protein kinase [Peterkaempfera bronchialis]|uniref:non-specific serine/threonine protein kinase n=1 Tax=Peterkaempfera bronchialis TaxID=2126346 RepID=A0A345SYH4_9ACTN|nr:serine/threonine-protein kinase [Peterkaempfera bronchialis]AXI78779.1 serine/threonine protein kinase [Peterkaempfera bronchialis]
MVESVLKSRRGLVLAGRYRLDEFLSPGGMGEIWKAYDERMERVVVVKFPQLHSVHPRGQRELVKRFAQEVIATARVEVAGALQIFDYGEEDGYPYLVMEYIRGLTLRDFMAEHGALELSVVASVAVGICHVLAEAHALGIVHRDIKPENVMITEREGLIKVLDFGIARFAEETGRTRLTKTGDMPGTVDYMAPEQFEGHVATVSSDLYSLGCVIYEMAAGRPVFKGASAFDYQRWHLYESPIPLERVNPDFPRQFLDLADSLLSKDPADRPGTADEVNRCLRRYLPKSGSPAPEGMIEHDPTLPYSNPCAPMKPVSDARRRATTMPTTPVFRHRDEVEALRRQAGEVMLSDPARAAKLIKDRLPAAMRHYGRIDNHVLDLRFQLAEALETGGHRSEAFHTYKEAHHDTDGVPALERYVKEASEGMRRCE